MWWQLLQRQAGGLLRVSRDAEEVSSRTGLRPLPSSPATQGILVSRPWRKRPLGTAPKKAYLLHDLMHDCLCSKPYSAQAMPLPQGKTHKKRTLETPTGRTSTDLLPCTMSTGALLMGPVHKCCSRSRACALPNSTSAAQRSPRSAEVCSGGTCASIHRCCSRSCSYSLLYLMIAARRIPPFSQHSCRSHSQDAHAPARGNR